MTRGRKPIHDVAMSSAERQRRYIASQVHKMVELEAAYTKKLEGYVIEQNKRITDLEAAITILVDKPRPNIETIREAIIEDAEHIDQEEPKEPAPKRTSKMSPEERLARYGK